MIKLLVWAYAKANNFIIVTKDSDFYDLSLIRGNPPQVIWIKTGNTTKSAIAALLLDNKEKLESLLLSEQLACVELY